MGATSRPAQSSRPQPPPLPEPRKLQVQNKAIITYIDVKPADYAPDSTPTIALIHGSPGNYKDFRYLIPLLQKSVRVVALNLPGFDDSEVIDTENHFEHVSAKGVAEIAYEALVQICGDAQNVFLVGHSFGGHTATNLAALNLERHQINVRGIGFLASAGHRPHRTLWPTTIAALSSVVRADLPVISSAAQSLVHTVFTKFVGFPDNGPTSHFVAALIRTGSTDYNLVNEQRKALAHIPAFVAWAKDDVHIEEEISLKLSEEFQPGPRFAFETGGHNIQKTKADVLALEFVRWTSTVIAGKN